jgi:hypothetical protein
MSPKTAVRIMLWLLVAVMLFHMSILLKITPYEITWGGRLKNDFEMYVFETLSMIINLFLFLILLIKGRFIKEWIPLKVVHVVLWFFFVLFVLNTIGNVLAETTFEKFFAVLTLALSFLIWVILTKGKKANSYE